MNREHELRTWKLFYHHWAINLTIMDQCVSMLYRDTKHETTVFSFRSIVLDSLRNREIPATKTRGKAKTQNDKYPKKENLPLQWRGKRSSSTLRSVTQPHKVTKKIECESKKAETKELYLHIARNKSVQISHHWKGGYVTEKTTTEIWS